MSEKEKKDKNVNETLEIINKIIDYNNNAQKLMKKKIRTKDRKKYCRENKIKKTKR